MRPAAQPMTAARTYCNTMMGRVGIARDPGGVGIVADRVDVGADPRPSQQERHQDAGERETSRSASERQQIALSEALEAVESRAPLHDIEL